MCEGVCVWCGVVCVHASARVCVCVCVWGGGGSAEFSEVEAVESVSVVNKDKAETAQSGVRPL